MIVLPPDDALLIANETAGAAVATVIWFVFVKDAKDPAESVVAVLSNAFTVTVIGDPDASL